MKNGKSGLWGKGRRASALMGLVAVLVLVVVVYGVQRWIKSRTPDPDMAQNLLPWKEWSIREKSQKPVPEPSEEQANITKILKYDANVELPETKEPRGEVLMSVTPEGLVEGIWSGTYYNSKKDNFDVQRSKFMGRIYPGRIYRDENGEDPSKLYFLAKGQFVMHKMSSDAEKYRIIGGDIYVNGWINPDFSVTSDITITSDMKYSETFHWKVGKYIEPKTEWIIPD